MRYLYIIICVVALTACTGTKCPGTHQPYENDLYADPQNWYDNGRAVDTMLADVFYILPTCVHDWTDENGQVQHYASLSDTTHRRRMLPSYQLADEIFADSANFFAPYYRHITLESWSEGDSVIEARFANAMADIRQAFAYYLQHHNHGRNFVLAGFSQGAKCVVELLKEMDDETYGRLVAAYVCGYKVTTEDLASKYIRPITDATDTGVTICYNTVTDVTGLSNSITQGTAYVCNPASWSTDTLPHMLNDSVELRIDPQHHVLLAKGIDAEQQYIPSLSKLFPLGNLHLLELTLYHDCLQTNVKQRIAAKKQLN